MFCIDRAHWLYAFVMRADVAMFAMLIGVVAGMRLSSWLRSAAARIKSALGEANDCT